MSCQSSSLLIFLATQRAQVLTLYDSFADVAQPDQARIVGLNAHHFLKAGGHAVVSIKANCIDSTAPAEVVFASEVKKMQEEMFKPHEQRWSFFAHSFRTRGLTRCMCSYARALRARSLYCRRAFSLSLLPLLDADVLR